MPIGPFTRDFLEVNPGPAIENKTAELFVNEGERLRKEIDLQSSKAEAAILGPILATSYTDAFQKLSKGDTTGFKDLSVAMTHASTNPFLASMSKEIGDLADTAYKSYMDQTLQTQRLQSQKDIESIQQKGANDRSAAGIAGSIKGAQIGAAASLMKGGQVSAAADQRAYNAQLIEYDKAITSWNEMMKVDPANAGPMPQKPQPPQQRNAGITFDPVSGLPTWNESDEPPLPRLDPNATNPVQNIRETTAAKPQPDTESESIKEMQNPPNTETEAIRLMQEQEELKKGVDVMRWGNTGAGFYVPNIEATPAASVSIQHRGVTRHYPPNKEDQKRIDKIEEDKKLFKVGQSIDSNFIHWVGRMSELGYAVKLNEEPDGKHFTAEATNERGQKQYWTDSQVVKDKDGATQLFQAWNENGKKNRISKEEKTKYDEGGAALQRLIDKGMAKPFGYGSQAMSRDDHHRLDMDTQARLKALFDPKNTDPDKQEKIDLNNGLRLEQGLSKIDSPKKLAVQDDVQSQADKIYKAAGFDPEEKTPYQKLEDKVVGFVKGLPAAYSQWNHQQKEDALELYKAKIEHASKESAREYARMIAKLQKDLGHE